MFILTTGWHTIFKLHQKHWQSTDLAKLLFVDTKNNIQLLLTTENGPAELGGFRKKKRNLLTNPFYMVRVELSQ